jgi:uncharacterized protein
MIIDLDVPIAMTDGTVLRADVFRPEGDGRYPVIMTHGPYAKGLAFQEGYAAMWDSLVREHPDAVAGSTNRYLNWETVDPEKWVPDGYAVVRVDSRGAGNSPGYLDIFSPQETRDYYECIEWVGVQPWSSGKVGLLGISYYGVNQWQVAALRPPHLTAICPWEGASDYYREFTHHGGILGSFVRQWYPVQVSSVQYGLGPDGPRRAVTGALIAGPERLGDEELLANRAPTVQELRDHPLLDGYYQQRTPDLSMIEVPVLSATNWGHHLHTRGGFEGYLGVASEQKWLEVHGLQHWVEFYTDYGVQLQKRFFGHFLKGEDTGWASQPPVTLKVRRVDGTFADRTALAWPVPETRWTELYLDIERGRLTREPVTGSQQGSFEAMGDYRTFWTDPFDRDVELTGPASARLTVSSTTTEADLFLALRVQDPNGGDVTFPTAMDPHGGIGFGWLRSSLRKTDPERSLPYRPWHLQRAPAARTGRAGRRRRRDLAVLGDHPAGLPPRGVHPRPRLRVPRRRAMALRLRRLHARQRDLYPHRRARPRRPAVPRHHYGAQWRSPHPAAAALPRTDRLELSPVGRLGGLPRQLG